MCQTHSGGEARRWPRLQWTRWHHVPSVRQTRLFRGHTALQRGLKLLQVDVLAITWGSRRGGAR